MNQIRIAVIFFVFIAQFLEASEKVKLIHNADSLIGDIQNEGGIGTATITLLSLVERLNTQTELQFIPFARQDKVLITADTATCALFRLATNERSKQYLFSRPTAFQPAHQLYTTQASGPLLDVLLNESGEVKSVKQLLNYYRDDHLLTTTNISYGSFLDEEVAKVSETQKITIQGFSTQGVHAKMLAKGRARFTISTPLEIYNYAAEDKGFEYFAYSIAGAPKIIKSRIMCNDTPRSRLFLNEVNEALRELYSEPVFRNAHTDFLPKDEYAKVAQAIDEEFNSPALAL
jgi:uncharacterized protein (TIGR02285 family)